MQQHDTPFGVIVSEMASSAMEEVGIVLIKIVRDDDPMDTCPICGSPRRDHTCL